MPSSRKPKPPRSSRAAAKPPAEPAELAEAREGEVAALAEPEGGAVDTGGEVVEEVVVETTKPEPAAPAPKAAPVVNPLPAPGQCVVGGCVEVPGNRGTVAFVDSAGRKILETAFTVCAGHKA